MNKLALPAIAAALALAACGETASDTEDTMAADAGTDTTTVVETPGPTPTETVIVDDSGMTDDDGSSVTIDGADVDATVDEDGVNAEIDVE